MNDPSSSANEPLLILLIAGAFFVVFPMFWCAVMWINSQIGGWARLARRYRSRETPTGTKWPGVQGMIGIVSYRGALECTTNPEGLFLQPMVLFRFAHPLLFIPWSEFREAKRGNLLWIPVVSASVGSPAVAKVRLAAKVFEGSEGLLLLEAS